MKYKILLLIIFLMLPAKGHADHLISVEKALKKAYSKTSHFVEEYASLNASDIKNLEQKADFIFDNGHSSKIIIYKAYENNIEIGQAFEDTVMGKWGPIHYLVAMDNNGVILKTIILDYDEIRGRPVAKKRFLKQYRGKSFKNPIRLRKDIDGISGATVSSHSLTEGVRKITHIYNILKNRDIKEI